MNFKEVLFGGRKWSVEHSECEAWLNGLPDNSIDLLICSPPYEDARTYGIDFRLAGEAYVAWMVRVIQAAAPKVKGPIFVVIEGRTEDYSYSATPFLLMADLVRLGFTVRKPIIYHRFGIPGSGGPDWLRNDWEPVLAITRPGRLPFSDPTACGHPPRWAPGGAMSHRVSNGARVNQWGKSGGQSSRNKDGQMKKVVKPSHKVKTKAEAGAAYEPPALANPGNAIPELYTADEVAALVAQGNDLIHCTVGGNQMGHKTAHHNEAPYPLELPTRLIKTFSPVGGVVCDIFNGSGTTCQAAIEQGRRYIGCDLRPDQVELTKRRMQSVSPGLFIFEGEH